MGFFKWAAQINDKKRFAEVFEKGVYNYKLQKMLIVHEPPLVTMATLKAAVHCYQTSLLLYARSTLSLASVATAGFKMVQQEEIDCRWKTPRQLQELHKKLDQSMTAKASESTAMEIDALVEQEEEEGDSKRKEVTEEGHEKLFVAPDQCAKKGHIKANCSKERRAGAQPWIKQQRSNTSYTKKTFPRKGQSSGGGTGRKFIQNSNFTYQKMTQNVTWKPVVEIFETMTLIEIPNHRMFSFKQAALSEKLEIADIFRDRNTKFSGHESTSFTKRTMTQKSLNSGENAGRKTTVEKEQHVKGIKLPWDRPQHLAPTILEREKHILDSTVTPEGPSNLSASTPEEGQVTVSWAPSKGATKYEGHGSGDEENSVISGTAENTLMVCKRAQ